MRNGFPGMSHTGAARAGVENMTKTLAIEWAPHKIRVNCVAPGVIYNQSADTHYEKNTGAPNVLQSAIPGIPARRLGTVDEVASAVVFLLSPGAQYISGVSLAVDGASSLTPSNIFRAGMTHDGWDEYRGSGKL